MNAAAATSRRPSSTVPSTPRRFGVRPASLCLLLAAGCASTSTPPTRPDARLATAIDAIVAEHHADPSGPGYGIMVVRDGTVVHARGYGLADLALRAPIERTTPFRLASVSKQFTCMAALRLVEQGRLSLDDPAARWVPSLERFGPDVTVRSLMHHTSGLPDYYGELQTRLGDGEEAVAAASVDDDPLFTTVDASALYRTWGEPRFAPGERFEYSNPGYEQLALVIEAASGQPFEDYLSEQVLVAAGMPTASVRARPETEIPGRAIGYSVEPTGIVVEFDDHPGNWILGAGGVYASLDDLYYWDRALWDGALVSDELLEQAFRSGVLTDGGETGYGFGWLVDEQHGRRRVSHGGAWVGFRTHIARYLDDRLTIVVLSNLAEAKIREVSSQVADAVFADDSAGG